MKIKVLIISLISILSSFNVYPCAVFITNDLEQILLLSDKNGNESLVIRPGEKKNFGQSNQRAHFYVMLENAEDHYVCSHIVRQIACSSTHHIEISASDILNNNCNKKLFTVSPYQHKYHTDRQVSHD